MSSKDDILQQIISSMIMCTQVRRISISPTNISGRVSADSGKGNAGN